VYAATAQILVGRLVTSSHCVEVKGDVGDGRRERRKKTQIERTKKR
jgi:hypothetical protein